MCVPGDGERPRGRRRAEGGPRRPRQHGESVEGAGAGHWVWPRFSYQWLPETDDVCRKALNLAQQSPPASATVRDAARWVERGPLRACAWGASLAAKPLLPRIQPKGKNYGHGSTVCALLLGGKAVGPVWTPGPSFPAGGHSPACLGAAGGARATGCRADLSLPAPVWKWGGAQATLLLGCWQQGSQARPPRSVLLLTPCPPVP